jgi:hypothetical protein
MRTLFDPDRYHPTGEEPLRSDVRRNDDAAFVEFRQ